MRLPVTPPRDNDELLFIDDPCLFHRCLSTYQVLRSTLSPLSSNNQRGRGLRRTSVFLRGHALLRSLLSPAAHAAVQLSRVPIFESVRGCFYRPSFLLLISRGDYDEGFAARLLWRYKVERMGR